MSCSINDTALLLFSRREGEESAYKKFLPGRSSANKKIAQKLIQRSISLGNQSGLPFFIWDEKLQHGSNFGEKLSNAVDAVFTRGYKKVVVIGNDCLALNLQHIQTAVAELQIHQSVIAPTNKGGAYLIGINKKNFQKSKFSELRWQSSSLYFDLQNLFNCNVFQLPELDDVNSYSDLHKEICHLSKVDLFRIFAISIFASLIKYFLQLQYCRSPFNDRFHFGLKAPPLSQFAL